MAGRTKLGAVFNNETDAGLTEMANNYSKTKL